MPLDPDDLVAVLVYDGLCTFEFGLAVEVFALDRPEFAFPWYAFAVASCDGPRVRATGGIAVEADGDLSVLAHARTIVLPGWRDREERPPEALLQALREAHARGARLVSICSGVFILAAAGLLDGRRATTHWRHLPTLRRLYPNVIAEADVLYVDEGEIISSAGSSAGIDACLHLVRRDHGGAVANAVARRLVAPPHRQGGQAQYVPAPIPARPGRGVARAMDWARENLSRPLTVADLAREAAMSERTFLRRFRDGAGLSPRDWLAAERAARAQDLLEATDLPLDAVAERCGYASPETFRAAFRRAVGAPPAAWRARFTRRAG
ncbi:MAG: transcriptional regulator FtrA [Albimonas sp.]|uniref:transcriptional regulator FtrA n=1 Tax=Albimonas sp. TaxID=1872425 RepID=UPI004056ECAB